MSTLKTHNLQSPDAGSVNIAMTPNAGMVVTGISTFTGASIHVGLSQFQNTINLTHASAGQNYIYFNEDLQFAKNGTGTRLKIDSNGNIGINQNNPTVKLQVTDTSAVHIRAEATANDGDALIQAKGKDSSGNDRMIQMRTDAGADQYRIISSDTSYNLALCTGNAPRVLIAGNSAATSIGGANIFNAMLTTQGDISGGLLMLKATENTNRLFVSGNNTSGCEVNLYDESGGQKGILGVSGSEFFIKAPSSSAPMTFHTHNGTSIGERLRIASNGFVGIGEDDPQTELNVKGTISTGRNVARELGTIINISSNHDGTRVGGNVINGIKNYEAGADWLAQGSNHVNANLTIDLGTAISCDRFVIYNQNEYQNSRREVKRFTLEGSNDNSSWTTVLDDNCGASNAHEPNPGWSFRIPSSLYDDDEGLSYRYWRFTMKSFQANNDGYGGIMELELYEQNNNTDGEITTSSLSAGNVYASTVQTVGQPSFHARLINHTNATQNPLIYDDVLVNVGNHYHSTGSDAGKFVVPVRGTYFFFWEGIKNSNSGQVTRLYLQKNASRTYNNMHLRLQEEGNYANGAMFVIMQLEPNDRIHIELAVGGVHASEYSHFGGYLIG